MDFNLTKQQFSMKAKAAAPYISFGIGIGSSIIAIASAIKATTKLSYILDEYEMAKNEIKEERDNSITKVKSEPDAIRELKQVAEKKTKRLYIKTAGKMALNYAPTIAFSVLSTTAYGCAFGMLRKKLFVATGALSCVTGQFDTYRNRVVEDLGVDKDKEYYYGVKKEKVAVKKTDPITGKSKTVKKELLVGEPDGMFAYRFKQYDYRDGSGSTQWESGDIDNYNFISGTIYQAQKMLDAGYTVHFDRLLDDLGFEHRSLFTEIIAGWVPGDRITCGLEADGPLTEDAYKFITNQTNDVTLLFNARPDIYGVIVLDDDTAKVDGFIDIPEDSVKEVA